MRAMSVARFGGPDVLELRDVSDPEPGPDEVSIEVAFAGVGFVDTLFRSGQLPLDTPFIPGIEVSGWIRAVGSGVDDLRRGQPVVALLNDFGRTQRAGGYAEIAIAHRSMLAPVPDEAGLAAYAGVAVNAVTAWIALHRLAWARPSDTVVVLGASGGLGGVAVRLASLIPCRRVVGVVGHDVSQAPAECSDVVLAGDLSSWAHEEANQIDVVIDPVGGPARSTLLANAAPLGRHVILGNASGEDPTCSTDAFWHGTNSISGLSLGAVAHLPSIDIQESLTAVLTLLDRGVLKQPVPDIAQLEEAPQVHEVLENRTAPAKTVLAAGRGERGE